MRRMYSEKQILELIKKNPEAVVEALLGQDINTGNVEITGNLAVSGSINGDENPSLKPVYVHPITIDGKLASNDEIHVSCLIFDNSNEQYNTYAKFSAKIASIMNENPSAIFPITGAMYYNTSGALLIAQKIQLDEDTLFYKVVRPDGTLGRFGLSNFNVDTITYYDGVNKLN